jgi:hypothetical protein
VTLIGIVPTGLYSRLGSPWWPGIVALFAAMTAGFFLAPDALLFLVGVVLPFAGAGVFGYRRQSYWWAVASVVAAWLVYAIVTTVKDGWDIGPAEDLLATVFFAFFLVGATLLGGVVGKHVASRSTSQ